MSFWDIEPEDWLRRFFGSSRGGGGPLFSGRGGGGWFGSEIPRLFDEIIREMERMFEEQFEDIQTKAPKELMISSKREPLADVTTSNTEVKVILEMPGVSKDKIKINAYDNSVEIKSDDPQRKYHEVIDLPPEADIETAKSSYRNGILEIMFNKKKETKPKGKHINVE